MFKKILIVYSEKLTSKHLETVEKVRNLLREKNSHTVKANELNETCFENVDLVITVGGDGTFIRAASFIDESLILGINSEPEQSEGGLTTIKENELDFIKDVLDNKFNIIKKDRIKIKIDGKEIKENVLNEVYIGTEHQFHTSRYILKFKGKEEEQRSSGILIATGSGSNVWYKSAGGIQFPYNSCKLKFLIREPFFARLFKPKLLNGEINPGEKMEVVSKRYAEQVIVLDSNKVYPFNNNSTAEIKISDSPLKIIVK